MKTAAIMIACTAMFGCASGKPKDTTRSIAKVDPERFLYKFEIDRNAGERYLPEDNVESEQREYQKLIDLFSAHFKNKYSNETLRAQHQDQGESGYALRGVHAKGHGCLAGTFTAEDHGQKDFQHGIFQTPKTYDVVARYSNGDGPPQEDNDNKLSVGMAFKVLDVRDEKLLRDLQTENSVDFLMTNHPNFIVGNIQDFVKVIAGREGGKLARIRAGVVSGKGLLQRLKVEKNDPLATSYWSNLPFKMGETVIKYLVRPETCAGESNSGEIPVTKDMRKNPDFLTDVLTQHIQKHSACFGFYLQRKGTDKQSPVENAAVAWPEDGFVTRVGTLNIPAQEPNENLTRVGQLNSQGLSGKRLCQDLSFSPWNTTSDFKPLSSLNRARRVVYELSAAMRRDINGATNPIRSK